MSETATKPKPKRDFLDPIREAQAVAALRSSIADLAGDDDQLLLDTIEGETGLFEVIDAVLGRMRDAQIMVEGVAAVVSGLEARKIRHEEAIKRDRALIEQAMTIAGLEKLARPTATLSLSQRPPTVLITEEAEIPARFWKSGVPSLDKKALGEALRERAAALAALAGPSEAPEGRAAALAALPPEIPGATLSNGAPSLTVRTR